MDLAVESLEKAYGWTQNNGFAMLYIEYGVIKPLFEYCLHKKTGRMSEDWLLDTSRRINTYARYTYKYRQAPNNTENPLLSLSQREEQVLDCLVDYLNTKQIAEHLGLSVNTVKVY